MAVASLNEKWWSTSLNDENEEDDTKGNEHVIFREAVTGLEKLKACFIHTTWRRVISDLNGNGKELLLIQDCQDQTFPSQEQDIHGAKWTAHKYQWQRLSTASFKGVYHLTRAVSDSEKRAKQFLCLVFHRCHI